ncbi:hypothetical protein C8R43DRAFT_1127983 [Mycena crocata]|nr:hypothetical protein C8R43DRAFT_1127983 [Mycena crocata]
MSRIYRSLEFSGKGDGTGYGPFCHLLLKSAKPGGETLTHDVRYALNLAHFVRECTFSDWTGEDHASAFLKMYCHAVELIPQIESFSIHSTLIPRSLIRAVSRSKTTLKTLRIRSCTLAPEVREKDLKELFQLKLRDLEYTTTSSPALQLSPSIFSQRQLESFRTDSWPFGLYFIKRQHPALRVLELHAVDEFPALFNFLAKCPTITDLTINSIVVQPRAPIPAFPAGALPNITTLKIPASFLPYFAHRPLRTISLAGVQIRRLQLDEVIMEETPTLPLLTLKDIAPLLQSTAALTELHIHHHIFALLPLQKHLRSLEVLVLAYHHLNFATVPLISSSALFREAMRTICNNAPASPLQNLHELRIDFGETRGADSRAFLWDLPLQREVIAAELCLVFPALGAVSFARFVKWERRDAGPVCTTTDANAWRAFVPHRFRELVRERLTHGKPFKDLGGCFAALDWKYM